MNKKLILLPISVIALGTIVGCNNKKEDPVIPVSNYFSEYKDADRELYTVIPEGTTVLDNDAAAYFLKEARGNTLEATQITYEFHKGLIMDASLLQVDASRPKTVPSFGYNYKHFSTIGGSLIHYDNSMYDDYYYESDYTTLNDKYKTDYVNELGRATYFATNVIEGQDLYSVASKNYGQVDNVINEEYYTLDNVVDSKQTIEQNINDEYKEYHATYKNSVFDTYDKLDDSIKELTETEVPCGKYAKVTADGKMIFVHLYSAESDESINNDVARIVPSLTELTEAQRNELVSYINKYSKMGIKLVVNPTNALDIDDRVVLDAVKANTLSFFNYFLPVFKNHEMVIMLKNISTTEASNWVISACTTKYNNYLIKNEKGVVLDTPLAYKSSYNYAIFDYASKGEHAPVSYKEERRFNSTSKVSFTEMGSTLSNKLTEISAFEEIPGQPQDTYVYEGYLTKSASTTAIGIVSNNGITNFSFGYDASYIHSNVEVSGINLTSTPSYWDATKQAILWPEGYNEVYVRIYIIHSGSTEVVYPYSECGMWLDFYKANSYES